MIGTKQRSWMRGLASVAAMACGLTASAAHAQCAGIVEVREWPRLRVVMLLGDLESNCVEVKRDEGVLSVAGLDGTTVVGSPVAADGPTTVIAILRGGDDALELGGDGNAETRLRVDGGPGDDTIDISEGFLLRLDIVAGAGNDSVTLGSATIGEPSSVDGGEGGDRLSFGGSILGSVDMTGFEGLLLP